MVTLVAQLGSSNTEVKLVLDPGRTMDEVTKITGWKNNKTVTYALDSCNCSSPAAPEEYQRWKAVQRSFLRTRREGFPAGRCPWLPHNSSTIQYNTPSEINSGGERKKQDNASGDKVGLVSCVYKRSDGPQQLGKFAGPEPVGKPGRIPNDLIS